MLRLHLVLHSCSPFLPSNEWHTPKISSNYSLFPNPKRERERWIFFFWKHLVWFGLVLTETNIASRVLRFATLHIHVGIYDDVVYAKVVTNWIFIYGCFLNSIKIFDLWSSHKKVQQQQQQWVTKLNCVFYSAKKKELQTRAITNSFIYTVDGESFQKRSACEDWLDAVCCVSTRVQDSCRNGWRPSF